MGVQVTLKHTAIEKSKDSVGHSRIPLNDMCALVHICREFLRKLLVGKAVTGLVLRVDPNTQREYGSVYLGPDPETAENVSVSLVKEGLAKVRQMSQVSGVELALHLSS